MRAFTKGNVTDVVSDCGVSVLQLQRRLSVTKENLRSCVAGTPALLKFLYYDTHTHSQLTIKQSKSKIRHKSEKTHTHTHTNSYRLLPARRRDILRNYKCNIIIR